MLVSTIPSEVFCALPEVDLPGSPDDYAVPEPELFSTEGEVEELALCHLLNTYAQCGEWSAIHVSSLQRALLENYDDAIVRKANEGLRELLAHGVIHYDAQNGGVLWPTPLFIEEIERYRQ